MADWPITRCIDEIDTPAKAPGAKRIIAGVFMLDRDREAACGHVR